MFGSQILQLAKEDRILKKVFAGIFPRDKLPVIKEKGCGDQAFVVNTATSDTLGEHWVGVYVQQKRRRVIWFDPFGFSPSYYGSDLNSWIKRWNYPLIEIKRQVQSYHSHYCGLFVLFVHYFLGRGLNLHQILKRFSSNHVKNDVIVCYFARTRLKFHPKTQIKLQKTKNELHKKMKQDLSLIVSKEFV